MTELAIPGVLLLPLLWAMLCLLLPPPAARHATLPGVALLAWPSFILWREVAAGGAIQYALAGWPAPLGIGLHADGLSALLVALTAVVGGGCLLHAARYLRSQQEATRYFWPLAWFLLAALNSIWLSGDLFNLYVGLELLGLAAVGLVALRADDRALAAALRYLLAALLGSLAYLLGVALIYGTYGSLALADLAGLDASPALIVALALMSAGLALKTALFPLHAWLPPAHGGALSPVSALLSALVVKASFIILLRLWIGPGAGLMTPALAQGLGLLGVAAMFWGGVLALRQQRLKMVVAYSTVAQLGYLLLLFPLCFGVDTAAASLGWQGGLLHLLAHALAKAALFLAAGNLVLAIGRDQVSDLIGVGRFVPMSLLGFGLASVSLMGLPPSGGFNAKWLMLQSALISGQWWWAVALVAGSLLSAAYLFRVMRQAFKEGPERDIFKHPPLSLDVLVLALAGLSLLLGLAATVPLQLLLQALPLSPGGG